MRPLLLNYRSNLSYVSIHAPREGCDASELAYCPSHSSFNSRTPGGVRRGEESMDAVDISVSIHAPREGCDLRSPRRPCSYGCFNSRTPGGVRHSARATLRVFTLFQFTHPGRGATVGRYARAVSRPCFNSRTPGGVRLQYAMQLSNEFKVSIHAPREGCDSQLYSREA